MPIKSFCAAGVLDAKYLSLPLPQRKSPYRTIIENEIGELRQQILAVNGFDGSSGSTAFVSDFGSLRLRAVFL
jgi:hypothetical protein